MIIETQLDRLIVLCGFLFILQWASITVGFVIEQYLKKFREWRER